VRGTDIFQESLFTTVQLESFVPADHPLRSIKALLDEAMKNLNWLFGGIYADTGRESIPPERLIRAQLLQVLYRICSERQLVEQINYNLLSDEHCSVDGTLMQAWASQQSCRRKDDDREPPAGGGRNSEASFHGEKRSNVAHESKTDGDARLAKKGSGKEARLSCMGHTVMENRNGLIVKVAASQATGKAEQEVAADLLAVLPGLKKRTVGADKNYDTAGFVADCRAMNVTPHVARNDNRPGSSAIDGRTSRHAGYRVGRRSRKRVEEPFGWGKSIGLIRQMKVRGLSKVNGVFMLTMIDWNLTRMRTLQGWSALMTGNRHHRCRKAQNFS
jgi:IS5 family transposase